MNVALTPHTKHTTIDRQGYTSFILTNKEIWIYSITTVYVRILTTLSNQISIIQSFNELILKL